MGKMDVPEYVLDELQAAGLKVVSIERSGGGHNCVRFSSPTGIAEAKWSWPTSKRGDPHSDRNNKSQLKHYLRRLTCLPTFK